MSLLSPGLSLAFATWTELFASELNLHGKSEFACCGSTQRGSRNRGRSVGGSVGCGTQIPHFQRDTSLTDLTGPR